jgi:hypothetical protein
MALHRRQRIFTEEQARKPKAWDVERIHPGDITMRDLIVMGWAGAVIPAARTR